MQDHHAFKWLQHVATKDPKVALFSNNSSVNYRNFGGFKGS